jgi:hypothetical protein
MIDEQKALNAIDETASPEVRAFWEGFFAHAGGIVADDPFDASTGSGFGPDDSLDEPGEKALPLTGEESGDPKITYEDETEAIRKSAASPEAQVPHDFVPAEWTHPNGHPRCRICGAEERIGGVCDGNMVPTQPGAVAPSRPKEVDEVEQKHGTGQTNNPQGYNQHSHGRGRHRVTHSHKVRKPKQKHSHPSIAHGAQSENWANTGPNGTTVDLSKAADEKGDISGHAFHGNRYTGGLGGAGSQFGKVGALAKAGGKLTPEKIQQAVAEFQGLALPHLDTSMTDRHPEFGGLRGDQAVALASYQRSGYGWMNEYLRGGMMPLADDRNAVGEVDAEKNQWRQGEIKAIDSAMEPSKNDMTVFRAIGEGGLEALIGKTAPEPGSMVTDPGLPRGGALRERLVAMVGTVLEDKAFCSTTTDKAVAGARVYHGEVVVEMSVPKGTGYVDMNAHHLNEDGYKSESEILLARGGKYEITGVRDEKVAEFKSEFPVMVLQMRRVA